MRPSVLSLLTAFLSHFCTFVVSIELTFELPDNERQCYFESIKAKEDCVIEFQVVTGGQYDVDMELKSPNGQVLYKDVKKQYDSFTWKTEQAGDYEVCFSNEFSSFSHKVVYMDWQIGPEKKLPGVEHVTALTQMETSSQNIHERLKVVDDYQTHHRLREATGRKFAEDISERITYWSGGVSFLIICVGIGQVIVLRSLFPEKRPAGSLYT